MHVLHCKLLIFIAVAPMRPCATPPMCPMRSMPPMQVAKLLRQRSETTLSPVAVALQAAESAAAHALKQVGRGRCDGVTFWVAVALQATETAAAHG